MRSLLVLLIFAVSALSCATFWRNADSNYTLRRDVEYARPDGRPLLADLYIPRSAASTRSTDVAPMPALPAHDPARVSRNGTRPAVLVLHSGSWRRGNKTRMNAVAEELARRGFVVLNVNYRLAPAARYPAQLDDCRAAVRYLRGHAMELGVDPARIGVVGYSAGGHLALMLGLSGTAPVVSGASRDSHAGVRVQAVATAGAPTDLLDLADAPVVADFVGADRDNRPEMFERASPIHLASPDDPPVLIVHGEYDLIVPREQGQRMAAALRAQRVVVEYLELPHGHVRTTTGYNEREVTTIAEFLIRTLSI